MAEVRTLTWLEKVKIRARHSKEQDLHLRQIRIVFEEMMFSNDIDELISDSEDDHYMSPEYFDDYDEEDDYYIEYLYEEDYDENLDFDGVAEFDSYDANWHERNEEF